MNSSPTSTKTPHELLRSSARPSPRVEKILSQDLNQAVLDYVNHPFDRRRRRLDQGDGFDPFENDIDYGDGNAYQPLRIHYILDPIEGRSDYVSTGFNNVLPEILTVVSETWSSHLSVYPADGSIPIESSQCFGFYSQYIGPDLEATGVPNADMAIYVGAETSAVEDGQQVELCSTGTLAFAFSCALDQFDRPVIGAINFCIDNILGNPSSRRRGLDVSVLQDEPAYIASTLLEGNDDIADLGLLAIHEVGHALGFSLNLLKYFRDPETGEPMTPRPFTESLVTCVDGTAQSMVFPAENTVATRRFDDGRVYHEVVTPRVTQVARNQFDCQSITGARLENQPTAAGYNCTGSHWDERLYLSELMGPIFSGYSDILSPLTLAIMEDSGWYKVNYENAKLSAFGKGRGCDFVNEPCIVNNQVPEYGEELFCNTVSSFTTEGISADEIVCDPTHKSFTACDLFDINNLPDEISATIPDNRVQYFSDPGLVSIFNRADFCPLPVIDARLDCTNTVDNANVPANYQGESRGLTSRCINGQIGSFVRPGCFPIECDASLHKVIINGQVCDFDGQELSVRTADFGFATLTCPSLGSICPDLFCPGECSGRGICNYGIVPPTCECFDESDTTAACSATPLSAPTPPVQGTKTVFFLCFLRVYCWLC